MNLKVVPVIKYIPEALLSILLFWLGIQTIDSYRQEQHIKKEVDALTEIQKSVAELHAETIGVSFNNTFHYDRQAQLQLQLDQTINQHFINERLNQKISTFNQAIFRYTQLATMLKTSRRFIASASHAFSLSPTETREAGQQLLSNIMAFSISPDISTANQIKDIINANRQALVPLNQKKIQWLMLERHILFLLENSQPESIFLEKIQKLSIEDEISHHINNTNNDLVKNNRNLIIKTTLLVFLFLCLLFTVFYRQHQQLKIKSALAEKATEVKSQFLANMSHEIRTPINGIMGLTDLCLKTNLDDKQHDYLKNIKFSVKSLMTIINDVLDFSKIESKKLQIENIGFNLTELIQHCKIIVEKNAADKGLPLIITIDKELPEAVHGDPVRWQQILTNLLSNAIKFTETGSVELEARAIKESRSLTMIHFLVKDTGIGLSQDKCAALFNRFIQAEASTTRKYGGTGLGLAICKQLTELMGGSISVNSTEGKGSCFDLYLPTTKTDNIIEENLPEKPEPTLENHQAHVLLVEDNQVNQMIAMEIIGSMGVEVDLAENGVQALEKVKQNHYDLIFMDIQMPEMGGIEATKHIRATYNSEKLPIIALTANVMSHEVEEYFNIGMNAYVGKPFNLEQLQGAVSQYCRQ